MGNEIWSGQRPIRYEKIELTQKQVKHKMKQIRKSAMVLRHYVPVIRFRDANILLQNFQKRSWIKETSAILGASDLNRIRYGVGANYSGFNTVQCKF